MGRRILTIACGRFVSASLVKPTVMDSVLYWVARATIGFLQLWPLAWVARFGCLCGTVAYYLDSRHRRVAIANLSQCFGATLSPEAIRAIALKNFQRLGENYASAIKTSGMTDAELEPHLAWAGLEPILELAAASGTRPGSSARPKSCVFAIGHFGNFELYARPPRTVVNCRTAATYRGLRQPSLDRLMLSLRNRSGCLYFERRKDAEALKQAMSSGGIFLGLLADQHAGDSGLWLPFLGTDCSTSAAPAVMAQRYGCPLYPAICYRIGMAKWRVEIGTEIQTVTREGGRRPPAEVMREVNGAFERAIRRDPANWFWVHKRWKAPKPGQSKKPATAHVVPE